MKLHVVKRVVIPTCSQSFLHVTTELSERQDLEPSYQLYEKHLLALANGLALVKPHCSFEVLLAKFSVHEEVFK